MDKLTTEYAEKIIRKIESLPDDSPSEQIEQTAERLEAKSYQPILLAEPPDFLRITKGALLEFIRDLLSRQDDLTQQHLNMLLYQYRLLQNLRRDVPEAWDEINELMDDD
jgi:hypothetical protein